MYSYEAGGGEHVMREASAISKASLKDEEKSNLRMFPPSYSTP